MKLPTLPLDYAERTYAGVLGKTIGVYLGRPFEQWTHSAIVDRLGEIEGYVHDKLGVPLIVADDDLSGTFTFLRALEDAHFQARLKPEDVGETWLNYLIEGRTVLWWGGVGHSTEHTAYLRLKRGILPPESGSIAQNGPIVAEQIGAQIFIDGWGLVCPGDPVAAAKLAKIAAVVSHDGEAVIAAQVVAAMVAAAFVAKDVEEVLEAGLAQASANSLIHQLGMEIRAAQREGLYWRDAFVRMEQKYNYETFPGGCHVIPNHALILLALSHGQGDFDLSMKIVNTCGYDTDCNSGNLGCILGVLNGLAGIGAQWRDPVADRLLLPTADGGRCITDCVREAQAIVRIAHGMRRLPYVETARFSFPFPGSVQGFGSDEAKITHASGKLRIAATGPATATTPTFLAPDQLGTSGYSLAASPTLYPGQTIRAKVAAVGAPLRVSLILRIYGVDDRLHDRPGQTVLINPGLARELEWKVPDLGGRPIAAVGFRLEGAGTLDVESLDWTGEPETSLGRTDGGKTWSRAWVNALSELYPSGDGLRAIQNEGTGLALHGTMEWADVAFSVQVKPTLAASFGIAVRAQGLRRYVAALIEGGAIRLMKVKDGRRTVLAETLIEWPAGENRELKLAAKGAKYYVRCGDVSLQAEDSEYSHGAIALVLTEGRLEFASPFVRPS